MSLFRSLIRFWSDPPLSDESDEEDVEEILELPKEMDVLELDGEITHLMEDFGLINDRYQFPRTMQPKFNHGSGPLRTGDSVRFRAERLQGRTDLEWTVVALLSAGSPEASKNDESVSEAEPFVH